MSCYLHLNNLALLLVTFQLLALLTSYQQDNPCPLELRVSDQPSPDSLTYQVTLATKYLSNRTTGPPHLIPYHIFQTNQRDQIPSKMKYAVNTLIEKNPQFSYRFFNSSERKLFVSKHLGETVSKAYQKLVPGAYQADLWRYSVVYVYGGCYVDIGMMAADSLMRLIEPQMRFVSTPDGGKPSYAGLNSAFFCAQPGHKLLQLVINDIVKTVHQQSYGTDMLDVTGPLRFKRAFLKYYNLDSLDLTDNNYGKGIVLYPRYHDVNYCLEPNIRDNEDSIIFYNKYPDYMYDMASYSSNPHYSFLYWGKKVYNKRIRIDQVQNYSIPQYPDLNPLEPNFLIPAQYLENN